MVKYSVVIPVHNEALVIRETYRRLKRVMEQTDGPYELLFVNDGSEDETIEILKEIAVKDETVKSVYAFDGGGMGVAFNGNLIVQRRYIYNAWRDRGIYWPHL
jgi:glycosyltransferase involved in cell wall biosynthesis